MKKIIYILLTLLIFNAKAYSQYDEVLDVSDALQSTLNTRASAIKIIKNYFYRNLKVDYISKNTDEILSNGEYNLLRLEMYAKDHPEIINKVKPVAGKWKNIRVLAIQNTKREKIKNLLEQFRSFLKSTNNLINSINKDNNIQTLKYQQAANNMEILAQQLALLYGMKVSGFNTPAINQEIAKCQTEFQKDVDQTFFSGENTLEISQSLSHIQNDWETVKKSTKSLQSSSNLKTIYVLMNKISDEARKTAILYQKKAKNQLKR